MAWISLEQAEIENSELSRRLVAEFLAERSLYGFRSGECQYSSLASRKS